MVRKKHAAADVRLRIRGLNKFDAESLGFNAMAEGWLARIRSRLPDSGTAVVTVHRLEGREFLISFRATALGETFISEARDASLDAALDIAGTHLLERISATPPSRPRKTMTERMRDFFE